MMGESAFGFLILATCVAGDVKAEEQRWLDLFVSQGLSVYNLYRDTCGPTGYRHTEAFREQKRLAGQGRYHTEETKRKLSEARRGVPRPWVSRQFAKDWPDLVGSDGAVHAVHNLRRFALERGLSPSSLASVARGQRRSHKGWRLADQSLRPSLCGRQAKRYRTLAGLVSPCGEDVVVTNVAAFCRAHNLNPDALVAVAEGRQQRHKGWRLADTSCL
jgi:hypothetical protein